MQKATFIFDNVDLTFNLVDNPATEIWKQHLTNVSLYEMCQQDHKVGFSTEDDVKVRTNRLYTVAESINGYIPNGIDIIYINESNWKEALNKMHIHFPTLSSEYQMTKEEFDRTLHPLLTEFNDIIHWLEKEYEQIYNPVVKTSIIYLDFNKSLRVSKARQEIPEEGYKLFTPWLSFGTLTAHYTHIGRHPYELFKARDYDCPKHQVVCQHLMTATCGMYFADGDIYREKIYGGTVESRTKMIYDEFAQFYAKRGGADFFGYELDDPKLAFGYMKIGELENVASFSDIESRNSLRETLRTAQLKGWEFS